MTVKLLTEHHFAFLIVKWVYWGSSESTLVKIPHCWKSRAMAQIVVKKDQTTWIGAVWPWRMKLAFIPTHPIMKRASF